VDDDPAIMRLFGWPFDTTQAFLRLVVSGTMECFPTLKIVTHHLGGGMMPFYSHRFLLKLANLKKNLQRPVAESLERIYGDTAVTAPLRRFPAATPSSARTTPSPRNKESGT
jgi:predicted TIM-barrel fold metal-dependent hydrolase